MTAASHSQPIHPWFSVDASRICQYIYFVLAFGVPLSRYRLPAKTCHNFCVYHLQRWCCMSNPSSSRTGRAPQHINCSTFPISVWRIFPWLWMHMLTWSGLHCTSTFWVRKWWQHLWSHSWYMLHIRYHSTPGWFCWSEKRWWFCHDGKLTYKRGWNWNSTLGILVGEWRRGWAPHQMPSCPRLQPRLLSPQDYCQFQGFSRAEDQFGGNSSYFWMNANDSSNRFSCQIDPRSNLPVTLAKRSCKGGQCETRNLAESRSIWSQVYKQAKPFGL